jgi:uncharacterized protein YciI
MTGILNRSIVGAMATFAILPLGQVLAQQVQAREQYVYVLQVAPRFQDEASWTETENAAVAQHFDRLAQATKAGQVILAGRTNEPLDKTFGLVIFEADSETAAREFMQADPAVIAGLMTATLHPYAVALQRK